MGDEDVIQTPGNEDSVGLRLRREQVEFVNEVRGQLVDIGDQFSARYESEMQPTQVALNEVMFSPCPSVTTDTG